MSGNIYSGQRFRHAISHFLLGRAAQALAFFALTLWLVRLLAPADYGAYMILWGMVEMMVPLSSLGMLEATRRFLPELAANGSRQAVRSFVMWMTLSRLVIMLIWAGVIAVYWPAIAAWLGFSTAQQNATWVAVGLIITVLGFRYAAEMLECLLEQRYSQLVHALMPVGRLIGVALLVVSGSVSLERILWVDLGISLCCFLLAEFFLLRRLQALPGGGEQKVNIREVVTFAWHMSGVNLLQALASFGMLRLLVGRMLGLEVAGMFAFLQQLLMIVGRYLPANLLANIIRPMLITRHAAGESDVVGKSVALLWKTNLIIIISCVLILSMVGNELINLLSGGRFPEAGLILLILFIGLGATTQGQLVSMAMQIFSYSLQLRNFSFLALLTPLAALAGSMWGLLGVAVGIVVSAWLQNNLLLRWLTRREMSVALDWMGIMRILVLAGVLVGLGKWLLFWISPWISLIFVMIAYGLGLWLVKPLSGGDMDILRRGLRQRARFMAPFSRVDR